MSKRVMLRFTTFTPDSKASLQECWILIDDILVIKARTNATDSRRKATIFCRGEDAPVYDTAETASELAAFIDSERV